MQTVRGGRCTVCMHQKRNNRLYCVLCRQGMEGPEERVQWGDQFSADSGETLCSAEAVRTGLKPYLQIDIFEELFEGQAVVTAQAFKRGD